MTGIDDAAKDGQQKDDLDEHRQAYGRIHTWQTPGGGLPAALHINCQQLRTGACFI